MSVFSLCFTLCWYMRNFTNGTVATCTYIKCRSYHRVPGFQVVEQNRHRLVASRRACPASMHSVQAFVFCKTLLPPSRINCNFLKTSKKIGHFTNHIVPSQNTQRCEFMHVHVAFLKMHSWLSNASICLPFFHLFHSIMNVSQTWSIRTMTPMVHLIPTNRRTRI